MGVSISSACFVRLGVAISKQKVLLFQTYEGIMTFSFSDCFKDVTIKGGHDQG